MADYGFRAPQLNPASFQFGMPSVAGGTLESGYGSLPGTGTSTPWQSGYSIAPGMPTSNMGFQLPNQQTNLGSMGSGLGGGGLGNNLPGAGFGFNMGTAQLGLDGLKTIGGLYGAYQANKLANEQFDFSKKFAEKNLTNQTQSYNDKMADTLNSRGFTSGTSKEVTAAEIERRKLTA